MIRLLTEGKLANEGNLSMDTITTNFDTRWGMSSEAENAKVSSE